MKKTVFHIATPYHKGTGFLIAETDLIATNERVVRDHPHVMVRGEGFPRQKAEVLLIDTSRDLAFLKAPGEPKNGLTLNEGSLHKGDAVWAVGYFPGNTMETEEGILTGMDAKDGVKYYRHNAILQSGGSGGPLLTGDGHAAGLNVFDLIGTGMKDGGLALTSRELIDVLEEYRAHIGAPAIRCTACETLQFEPLAPNGICTVCGGSIIFPSQREVYRPGGMSKTIEQMLEELGFDPELTRRGPDNWEIQRGSASIHISYHEKTGMIVGDAALCSVGEDASSGLFEYLLEQNFSLEHLTFSMRDGRIMLSLLIYDRYFTVDTGTRLFDHLFTKSDEFDNILVEKYGAEWLKA